MERSNEVAAWAATVEQLYEALDDLPDGIALLDAKDRYVYWNRRYAELYPGGAADLRVGLSFEAFVRASLRSGDTRHDDMDEESWVRNRLAQHALPSSQAERMTSDGRWIRASERKTRDGGSIGVRTDITELKEREASVRLLFESNPLPMLIFDPKDLSFLAVNDAALELYGYDRSWFSAHTVLDIRPAAERAAFLALVERRGRPADGASRTWTHLTADGKEVTVIPFSKTLTFEGRHAVLCCTVDITERRRIEAQLDHAKKHDAVTGLPNLGFLREHWGRIVVPSPGRNRSVSVLRVSFEGLTKVNVVEGLEAEEALTLKIADGLREVVSMQGLVVRLGGDEFVVVEHATESSRTMAPLVNRIMDRAGGLRPDGSTLTVHVGIASGPASDAGASPEELLRRAGLALKIARVDGPCSFRFFEEAMDKEARRRGGIERDLRRALADHQLTPYYQPFVELASGRVRGFEALLRWRRDDGQFVPPSEFIPIAEENGLIEDLGAFVLWRACADAASWPSDVMLAVNLSPAQFGSPALERTIREAIEASGLDPRRLEVEITETLLLANDEANVRTLHRLRALGIGVALDDFGTGYSSLGYLRSFPFTKIKIDRSFVAGLEDGRECYAVVRAISQIASDLGMQTTAEGVETARQLDHIRQLGCSHAQGFLFSPPRPSGPTLPLWFRHVAFSAFQSPMSGRWPPSNGS